MINLESLVVGPFGTNCYILKSEKEGIIIDPGGNSSQIEEKTQGLKIKYILLTHLHFDHLEALGKIQTGTKAKIGLNEKDFTAQKDPFIDLDFLKKNPDLILFLNENDSIFLSNTEVEILETPGHTPGGLSFYIEKEGVIINGDTLFKNGVGRTDLPCSNQKDLKMSLKKILSLPDKTTVYPGHGKKTTIRNEKKNFI